MCEKRVNQVEEPDKQEDQRVETVPLAPAERAIDDDTINGKGPTDDEWKIVQAESNETVNDTTETSKVMVAERVVQGSKRHISDSDTDGKIQHRRARIHPVPNLGAGKRRDKTASSSAAEKVSTVSLHNHVYFSKRLLHGNLEFILLFPYSINDHSG